MQIIGYNKKAVFQKIIETFDQIYENSGRPEKFRYRKDCLPAGVSIKSFNKSHRNRKNGPRYTIEERKDGMSVDIIVEPPVPTRGTGKDE